MSKIYKKYLELKKIDPTKCYLFESGIFYLFVDEDAKKVSDLLHLKLTHLNDDVYKCGFPTNSILKYLNLFKEHDLEVSIVDKEPKNYNVDFCLEIINLIKSVDVDKLTPIDALNMLSEIKEKL